MCTDVDINSKIDDMQVKRLVTTGTATGRFMNKDFFDFPVTWKLWISVNSLPSTNDFSDAAMWRRVIVVPFAHTFTDEEVDKSIKTDLKENTEITGIWNWMIGAALEVKHNGSLSPRNGRIRSRMRSAGGEVMRTGLNSSWRNAV